jgi:Domain of unknown function (DUF4418)
VRTVTGIMIVLLAIGIAFIPQLTKCHASTMTCNYTAKAEMALAIPIAVEGLALIFTRKEYSFGLALVGVALGISVVLVATCLIGVCVSMIENMKCQTIMKPSLILFGSVLIIVNGWLLWNSRPKKI